MFSRRTMIPTSTFLSSTKNSWRAEKAINKSTLATVTPIALYRIDSFNSSRYHPILRNSWSTRQSTPKSGIPPTARVLVTSWGHCYCNALVAKLLKFGIIPLKMLPLGWWRNDVELRQCTTPQRWNTSGTFKWERSTWWVNFCNIPLSQNLIWWRDTRLWCIEGNEGILRCRSYAQWYTHKDMTKMPLREL